MSIDIDALTFGLFKKLSEIVKIMSRNDDERSFFNGQTDLGRNRIAVSFSIGFVKQSHTFEVNFAYFQNNREKFIHSPILHTDSKQRLEEEIVHTLVGITENQCVVSICGNTTNTK